MNTGRAGGNQPQGGDIREAQTRGGGAKGGQAATLTNIKQMDTYKKKEKEQRKTNGRAAPAKHKEREEAGDNNL